ncbi:extracellular solute-binding protein [Humibacter ginsenosidimutans]|uniref:Extracellular solute-binding protein n=1 Tax=Humibacter ginsenosidimutans TaxID=2599293 RepID=A0A5B8M235_9MICO|nr:extracellular solute-binding protein [Humibacter ginsenosidimutans]QDZ14828.1 extracellular solute-binding protein [Humibacter ginsenosidimutans]
MRKSRILAVGAVGIAAALALSACSGTGSGSSGDNNNSSSIGKVDGKGKTLTVWEMNGDLSTDTLNAINKEFTKQTGAKVKVQMQQWDGIGPKVTTALSTSTPPDVIDIGNTQVAGYAANGGLLDLTKYKSDLEQGGTWLGGLVDPATVNGKLYGVPSFAGTRAVIYNKKIWAAAGVTEAPTTYDELTADLDKVKAANASKADFSAFYLPGQNWYAGTQFVWDAGGQIATQSGKTWKGGFSSDAAQKGLNDFKKFENAYSVASARTLDTDKPDQDQVFADGKAGAILGNGWEIGSITTDNKSLTTDDLGSFPFPGTSGKNQPVMLGGSVWSIPVKSKNSQLALVWTKIASSPSIQNKYVYGVQKWIPNTVEGAKKAIEDPTLPEIQKGFFTAAQNSKSTPSSANWATIESTKAINQFFSSIASGSATPADAAKSFDATLEKTLNGN